MLGFLCFLNKVNLCNNQVASHHEKTGNISGQEKENKLRYRGQIRTSPGQETVPEKEKQNLTQSAETMAGVRLLRRAQVTKYLTSPTK